MTTEKDSVSNSTDGEQDQIQSTSFEENSTNQVQSVTPDNQILVTPIGSPNVINPPASHCSPVRRRAAPSLGPTPTLTVQQRQAFAELYRRLPETGPYNFINLTTSVEAKLAPMGLSGTAGLKKKKVLYKEAIEKIDLEERLINREPTQEVRDTNAQDFEIIRIALRNLQKEINASVEEACRPTKFQRSGSPSNDGDPGNSSASHIPKIASMSISKTHLATNKRSTIQTIEPVSFVGNCAKPNDALISAVGFVVCSLVGSYFVIKLVIKLSSKVESNTIIQAINFLDLDIMQETELLTLKY